MTTLCADLDDNERTRCEIWTRVMGYHRPVAAFNPGKQAEHAERKLFREGVHSLPPATASGCGYQDRAA